MSWRLFCCFRPCLQSGWRPKGCFDTGEPSGGKIPSCRKYRPLVWWGAYRYESGRNWSIHWYASITLRLRSSWMGEYSPEICRRALRFGNAEAYSRRSRQGGIFQMRPWTVSMSCNPYESQSRICRRLCTGRSLPHRDLRPSIFSACPMTAFERFPVCR